MRRRLSVLIAFVGLLGMIGFAPVAQAGHDLKNVTDPPHEGSPVPVTPPIGQQDIDECVVLGDVSVGNHQGNGGVDLDPMGAVNHNHYRFQGVQIVCAPGDTRYSGRSFDVEAAGGTDGGGLEKVEFGPLHGESASVGWSHSSCYFNTTADSKSPWSPNCSPPAHHKDPGIDLDDLYDGLNDNTPADADAQCTNCGEITVKTIDPLTEEPDGEKISDPNDDDGSPLSANNWVKFCRGVYIDNTDPLPTCTGSMNGSNVIAWGALTSITSAPGSEKVENEDEKAANEVVCFHTSLEFIPEPKVGDTKVNEATLVGEAVIWVTNDKGDCQGSKGKKTE